MSIHDLPKDNVVILTTKDKIHLFFEQQWHAMKKEIRELCTFHPDTWRDAFRRNPTYPIFRKGDIDGLVALFIDNMATLLTIILSLLSVLDSDIVYGKIVPGVALALIWGNFYYVYMARKLAYKEKREDICAMPYGINTPGAFAFVFGIIFPVYNECMRENNGSNKRSCQELAWYIALAGNFITGIIILLLCVFGEFIRRNIPGVALLSSLSAVGFTYLALNQYLPIAASPIVSFLPFAIVMIGYFSGIKVGPFPIASVALVVGTALGWATSLNKGEDVRNATVVIKAYAPEFTAKAIFAHMNRIGPFLSTTIPTAISIAIGTIQCVESAKRAGDFYPTRESMFADGIGTIIASFFGSFLGMTTYIGHPAYKKMGARQAYSLINCLIYVPLCFFGIIALLLRIITVVAVNPVIIFIGLFICAETLAITPPRHYPAFLLGIMPAIADWARTTIINGVSSAYSGFTISSVGFEENVTLHIKDFSYRGLNNFAGGSLLQCIFLTVLMIYMIDRKFTRAIIWSVLASILSFFGLIHASTVGVLYRTTDDGWQFTVAYAMLAVVFILFEIAQRRGWVQEPETEPDDLSSEEWAEWNKNRITAQTGVDNTTL
ncbi:unnamed protein product [Rotaria sp. Silwood2]|nr:unnamed protein product [Rotaria sp. Silwood2]CAF3017757.1 unnamed protein product [Rotaria sp. Silwood2]CAF4439040.1 unnamed protein product [Rotaria sp. Silwood2]CAF4513401.1 unnamed protein product [Rotaria sp. Silwood2]